MTIENDETLQVYIEESVEHLADIENDFLAIEEAGADIDEEMVNKVYRAAHSIKGGAGFMGLDNIKELTHEMENILGKIRSREMVPNPEIVNILLLAADEVRNLINDVFNSNDVDISQHLESLRMISEGAAFSEEAEISEADDVSGEDEILETDQAEEDDPVTEKEESLKHGIEQEGDIESEDDKHAQDIDFAEETSVEEEVKPAIVIDGMAEIKFPDKKISFIVTTEDLENTRSEGKYIYLVDIDLIKDNHVKDKNPLEIFNDMQQTGDILDCKIDLDVVGTLDEEKLPDSLPVFVMFATILKPNDINMIFGIDEKDILILDEELIVQPLTAPEESKPAEKPEAVEKKETKNDSEKQAKKPEKTEAEKKLVKIPAVQTQKVEKKAEQKKKDIPMPKAALTETSLRVHVSLLDSLMNLAGELVLSRNQLLQSISAKDKRASETAGQRIDMITSELQEAIMLTRMQSIGNVFNKFPRVVRDLARNLGKEVDLSLEGKEVELDKTIIEAISDPLTHLVRNSVDHGIETPEERRKAGKNTTGKVVLKAYHAAGQVNIEISDDGKGLDGDKLAKAAIEKGRLTEDQARAMSENEKVNLIFMPGFSMAKEVTDVSGRGVGMDVVKTNLDKLGGQTEIDSKPGEGTTIRIKLPLTLAIIPSQIILCGGERYAIPQVNMEELLRIPADQVKNRIEKVGDAEVVRLRGNLLPLIRLADVIEIERTYYDPEDGDEKNDRRESLTDRRSRKSPLFDKNSNDTDQPGFASGYAPASPQNITDEISRGEAEQLTIDNQSASGGTIKNRQSKDRRFRSDSALNIVVVSSGTMKYGLVVDKLYDSEEIVVKPLGRHLKHCKGYAGATIMGDGRVALILDVGNLAQMAGLTSVEGSDRAAEAAKEEDGTNVSKDMQSLLVFRCAEDEQFAVPLNLVERIEKIKKTSIEEVGEKRVIQYRGGSLMLFGVDEVAKVKPLAERDDLLVIVFVLSGRELGLLAIGPVDAVELSIEIDGDTLKQDGIMGSAIIGEQTTQLVDIYALVHTMYPELFSEKQMATKSDGEALTILYAEDSRFFRTQVKSFLEEDGYNVIEAEDGQIAWNLLQEHADEISLVLTDIEMPNLDGLGFTRKIKEDGSYSHLPVIAMTTLAGDDEMAKGKEAGVDDYLVKLDREKLMESISGFLNS